MALTRNFRQIRAAKNPRIKLHFLPAYSPNLNTIERVWKIMHKHTVNNAYSPTFKTFTEKIRCFFTYTFPKNAPLWVGRLTDNFTPRLRSHANLALAAKQAD